MKLWMSGEIQADVADAYRVARKSIEEAVNQRLQAVKLSTPFQKWAFIAIIRAEDHPDYGEVKQKDTKRGVIEFRLKVEHQAFLNADAGHQKQLIIEALKRSVSMMAQMGVAEHDCGQLRGSLSEL
jgi:hypothetical protein